MLVYTEQTHKTKPVFILRHQSHKSPLTVKRLPNRRSKKSLWLALELGGFIQMLMRSVTLLHGASWALCKQPPISGCMNEAEVRCSTSALYCNGSHATAILSTLTDQHIDLNYDMLSLLARLLDVSKKPHLIIAVSVIKRILTHFFPKLALMWSKEG